MRTLTIAGLAGVGVLLGILPAAAGSTTRIESRPFYGATVTLEEGVRVFRPLPPHDRVIINPNNTPLSLGFSESHNYYAGGGAAPVIIEGGGPDGQPVGIWGGAGGKVRSNQHSAPGKGASPR